MQAGEKRRLTDEERIRFGEEERHLKESRGLLETRLSSVRDELETARIQERQLKEQVESIGSQITSQKENRNRQLALQLELNKSLSKTREAYMKCVMDAMASGNLAQKEGLAYIVDETIKETLTLDEMDGRPYLAKHRIRSLSQTCLDLQSFFPPSNPEGGAVADNPGDDNQDELSDPTISSTCPVYNSEGRCWDQDCTHHESGEPRVPPHLDPLPDLSTPDVYYNANDDCEDGEVSGGYGADDDNCTSGSTGNIVTAWWGAVEQCAIPKEILPLRLASFLQTMGLRINDNDHKLYLEMATGETLPGVNIGRYVDGFRLALHAGVMAPPFDLDYLSKALQDLGFGTEVIKRVHVLFRNSTSYTGTSHVDACSSNFKLQLELLKAVEMFENGTIRGLALDAEKVDQDSTIDDICVNWETRQQELSRLTSWKRRRTETLKILARVGFAVLTALERAACDIRSGRGQDLASLSDEIDQALLASLQLAFDDTFLQLLLAPLFAGNVTLTCALKMYHKAYFRIEALLSSGPQGNQGVNLLIFSQLLWSQVLQLRMCLPPRDVDSAELSDYRTHLDSCIDDLGIQLRQVRPVVGRVK